MFFIHKRIIIYGKKEIKGTSILKVECKLECLKCSGAVWQQVRILIKTTKNINKGYIIVPCFQLAAKSYE